MLIAERGDVARFGASKRSDGPERAAHVRNQQRQRRAARQFPAPHRRCCGIWGDGTPCSWPAVAAVPRGGLILSRGAAYLASTRDALTGGGVLFGCDVGTTTIVFLATNSACRDACMPGNGVTAPSKTSPAVATAVISDATAIANRWRERRFMSLERRVRGRRDGCSNARATKVLWSRPGDAILRG